MAAATAGTRGGRLLPPDRLQPRWWICEIERRSRQERPSPLPRSGAPWRARPNFAKQTGRRATLRAAAFGAKAQCHYNGAAEGAGRLTTTEVTSRLRLATGAVDATRRLALGDVEPDHGDRRHEGDPEDPTCQPEGTDDSQHRGKDHHGSRRDSVSDLRTIGCTVATDRRVEECASVPGSSRSLPPLTVSSSELRSSPLPRSPRERTSLGGPPSSLKLFASCCSFPVSNANRRPIACDRFSGFSALCRAFWKSSSGRPRRSRPRPLSHGACGRHAQRSWRAWGILARGRSALARARHAEPEPLLRGAGSLVVRGSEASPVAGRPLARAVPDRLGPAFSPDRSVRTRTKRDLRPFLRTSRSIRITARAASESRKRRRVVLRLGVRTLRAIRKRLTTGA